MRASSRNPTAIAAVTVSPMAACNRPSASAPRAAQTTPSTMPSDAARMSVRSRRCRCAATHQSARRNLEVGAASSRDPNGLLQNQFEESAVPAQLPTRSPTVAHTVAVPTRVRTLQAIHNDCANLPKYTGNACCNACCNNCSRSDWACVCLPEDTGRASSAERVWWLLHRRAQAGCHRGLHVVLLGARLHRGGGSGRGALHKKGNGPWRLLWLLRQEGKGRWARRLHRSPGDRRVHCRRR